MKFTDRNEENNFEQNNFELFKINGKMKIKKNRNQKLLMYMSSKKFFTNMSNLIFHPFW